MRPLLYFNLSRRINGQQYLCIDNTTHGLHIKQHLRLSTNANDHLHPQLQMRPKRSSRKGVVAKTHSTLRQYLG